MKKTIVAICLALASSVVLTQPSVSIRMSPITFGSSGSSVSLSLPPVYIQSQPQIVAPVVLTPSQVPYYDQRLHGYCSGYRDSLYAKCIENAHRQEFEDAYKNNSRR